MSSLKLDWNKIFEFTWRILVFIVAIAIILVVTSNWNRWEGRQGWQSTDDAYLQSDLTPISAKVTGYVRELPIQDYERVRGGQVLARLVDVDYRAAVAEAQARILTVAAQGQALQAQRQLQLANVQAARAAIVYAVAAWQQNGRDLARQGRLLRTGSSSTEAREKLQTLHTQEQAQIAESRARATAAESELMVLQAQLEENAAALVAAHAALATANLNLQYTTIIAPQDGVLSQRQVKPGELVGVGTQITTLTPLPKVWVIANYKETQLTHMAVGQKARIRVDTFPGHTLRGHIQSFAPASGAEFALLPPDNATGNFTKVVQRISVKIVIDDADGLRDRLVPGMSVIASVYAVDHKR